MDNSDDDIFNRAVLQQNLITTDKYLYVPFD